MSLRNSDRTPKINKNQIIPHVSPYMFSGLLKLVSGNGVLLPLDKKLIEWSPTIYSLLRTNTMFIPSDDDFATSVIETMGEQPEANKKKCKNCLDGAIKAFNSSKMFLGDRKDWTNIPMLVSIVTLLIAETNLQEGEPTKLLNFKIKPKIRMKQKISKDAYDANSLYLNADGSIDRNQIWVKASQKDDALDADVVVH